MLSISHIILLVFLVNAIQGGVPVPRDCPENEKFTCGSVCLETCETKPLFCVAMCKFDCHCQDGYVRQSNATNSPCIRREHCEKPSTISQCGSNEEYQECGSSCPPTCADFSYPLPKEPMACIDMCNAGCFCKPGYYRAKNGQCVQPRECCTGENERYTDCGLACVETCSFTPKLCKHQCVEGCFCTSPDYVRQYNTTGATCVHRRTCPK